ncbi:hypothetical protein CC86DRAFT_385362 [Ophiobolus disseminans]|uniref:F-box domain-containing protein n=1 Tax=Ophiobolus disseminans TaxID=1469910 RepID=A0A6A6ZNN5_9PLEO|nr:hypothetical protein CC86DRAFT_385362 [Ophiobolus disseminans]
MKGLLDLIADDRSYYPIHSCILSHLDFKDILSLQLVCKEISHLYKTLLKTQWNIDTRLKLLFSDVPAFRSLQSKTNTLIVGPVATGFFRHSSFEIQDEDVQLIVRKGHDAEAVQSFLRAQDYDAFNNYVSKVSVLLGVDKVEVYVKGDDQAGYYPHLLLLHAQDAPITVFLQNVEGTCDACFITWNKAYCLFPVSTMLARESFLMAPLKDKPTAEELKENKHATAASIKAVKEQGYKVKTGIWQVDTQDKPATRA